MEDVPQGVYDVAISCTEEDKALAEFIKSEALTTRACHVVDYIVSIIMVALSVERC